MKNRKTWLLLVAGSAVIWAAPRIAIADLVFQDNFESWPLESRPDQPGVTDQAHWSYVVGDPVQFPQNGHLVHPNPLIDAKNLSAQVLESIRDSTPAERAFIDLTPAQQTRLANGELLTVTFKHYQPDPNRSSIAFGVFQNSNHNFTENSIDAEFLANREVKQYKDSINNFQSLGLFGTADWDDVKIVANFATDTWNLTLNGVSSGDVTFRNDGDYQTAASLIISPSTGHETGYTDDLKVFIGSTTVGVPGDYNGNGVVDAADYVLWRKGGPLQNEVNTPGTVDPSDYSAWRARFGNTSGSGTVANTLSAVPEPCTSTLLLLPALIIVSHSWSARRRIGK